MSLRRNHVTDGTKCTVEAKFGSYSEQCAVCLLASLSPHLLVSPPSVTAMKSFAVLLAFACAAIAPLPSVGETAQVPLEAELMTSYPGFDLDLGAQRLVQIEGQSPVWMTELEKVRSNCFILIHLIRRLRSRSERRHKALISLTCEANHHM
jgi:hypothetical protein